MTDKKVKCNCPCHKNPDIKHVAPCCENGYITVPEFLSLEKKVLEGEQPTPAPVSVEDVCPLCKGSGEFVFPKKLQIDSVEIKKQIVLALHEKGYSLRQIQNGVGYKSARSVHKIIHDAQTEELNL